MQNTNSLQSLFLLDKEITFLNFGSFGATPRPIFEDYQQWQAELEFEPAQFMMVNGPVYLKQSREALGKYINCEGDDIVYTTNPSYAVNMVANSFGLKSGDEVLTTDLEYGACVRTWEYYCEKNGAKLVRQPITLPVKDKQTFIDEFFKGFSSKTKLVFLSHITSTTALKFPVHEICEIAKQKGVITFVDGAHAPGHVPLDLQKLHADIYTGACHKWMMTPKGSSFIYVRKDLQDRFDPLIISWGYKSAAPSHSRFQDYHQFNGTRDFSAFLTIPKSIEFMKEYNWDDVSKQCCEMVRANAPRFCELVGLTPLAPVTNEFLGQMFSIPIKTNDPAKLQKHLFTEYKIEIPVMPHNDATYLRYSINAFNSQNDLDRLYSAVKEIKQKTNLLL
jgi:isopenicillin-N epimerase